MVLKYFGIVYIVYIIFFIVEANHFVYITLMEVNSVQFLK